MYGYRVFYDWSGYVWCRVVLVMFDCLLLDSPDALWLSRCLAVLKVPCYPGVKLSWFQAVLMPGCHDCMAVFMPSCYGSLLF
jgi:hypothetical protein